MRERFRTFTVLITKISRCIRKIKTEEMDELNLKNSHVSCLYYLYKMNNLTAAELCDICKEDKASISRAIEFLESGGYLVCDDAADKKRYKSSFVLSEKGKQIASKVAEKVDNILLLASEGLTEEKREIFYDSLERISKNLEKICENYDK